MANPLKGSPDRRAVRSYVRRQGRMTQAQRRALARLWPRYGVAEEGPLDLDAVFGREARRFAEVGFGVGEVLVEMARTHPERDYLGIEVYDPGIGRLLARLEALDLRNVRIVRDDAAYVFAERLADRSLDAVLVLFPDPWPKKRHHKRRLVQPSFVADVRSRLKAGGIFNLATDWEDYAWQMLEVVEADGGFLNLAGARRFSPGRGERPATRFEARGCGRGHPVWDLIFEKSSDPAGTEETRTPPGRIRRA